MCFYFVLLFVLKYIGVILKAEEEDAFLQGIYAYALVTHSRCHQSRISLNKPTSRDCWDQ